MERLLSRAELSYQPMANLGSSARAKPVQKAKAPQTGRYTTSSNRTEGSLSNRQRAYGFDHVANRVVNANHGIRCATEKRRTAIDCIARLGGTVIATRLCHS